MGVKDGISAHPAGLDAAGALAGGGGGRRLSPAAAAVKRFASVAPATLLPGSGLVAVTS